MRSLTLLDESGAMPPLQALSEQDATRPVVLIGFQKQGNLGIGYLAATLMRRGHRVKGSRFRRCGGADLGDD
jgi:hypothetical protein